MVSVHFYRTYRVGLGILRDLNMQNVQPISSRCAKNSYEICASHCFQPVFYITWCLNHRKANITRLFPKISLTFERAITERPSPIQLTERPPFHSMILFYDFVTKIPPICQKRSPNLCYFWSPNEKCKNAPPDLKCAIVCTFVRSCKTPGPSIENFHLRTNAALKMFSYDLIWDKSMKRYKVEIMIFT